MKVVKLAQVTARPAHLHQYASHATPRDTKLTLKVFVSHSVVMDLLSALKLVTQVAPRLKAVLTVGPSLDGLALVSPLPAPRTSQSTQLSLLLLLNNQSVEHLLTW